MPTPEEMLEKIHRALEDPTQCPAKRGALKKRQAFFEAELAKPVEPPAEPKKKAPKAKKA